MKRPPGESEPRVARDPSKSTTAPWPTGEGTVVRRADGRWVGVFDLGYLGGKRLRKSYYGKTEAEAAAKLREGQRRFRSGLDMSRGGLTVAAFLSEWLATVGATLRPTTYSSYEMVVRTRLMPKLGSLRLTELRAVAIDRLLRDLSARGLSSRTVQYTRAVLRSALTHALRRHLVERNEAALASPPRLVQQEIQPLSPDEIKSLLAQVRHDRLNALYVLALATGMREGELLGLRWRDVELAHGRLRVRHSLARIDGRLVLTEPKTTRSKRTIVLAGVAQEALRARRRLQLEERLRAGAEWVDMDYVFATTLGKPLDGVNVLHAFQRHLARAGVPRRRFHDLRHSAATLLLVEGASPVQVMHLLGHSSISLTLGTYSHIVPHLEDDTASKMDDALSR